jgi:hypothetical protein
MRGESIPEDAYHEKEKKSMQHTVTLKQVRLKTRQETDW